MLIIAIPKSASESLVQTLAELHDRPGKIYRARLRPAKGFERLAGIHSDVREYSPAAVRELANPGVFYKNHVPPTKNNRALLRSVKKVVLLRDPEDVLASYRRGIKARTDKMLLSYLDEAFAREVAAFARGWSRTDRNTLQLRFEDVIRHPQETVNRIERFFGLPESRNVVLKKFHYTRNPLMNFARKLKFVRRLYRWVLSRRRARRESSRARR